ncbi:MAG: hypothetical protein RL291_93 [Pseudomonadota bacterium]|jgi:hypothetical protein
MRSLIAALRDFFGYLFSKKSFEGMLESASREPKQRRALPWIMALFAIFAVLMHGVIAWWLWETSHYIPLLRRGVETTAQISSLEYEYSGRRRSGFRLSVAYTFETADGRRHTGRSARAELARNPLAGATVVPVVYDPQNPSNSYMAHWLSEEFWKPITFMVIMAVPLVPLWLWPMRYRQWRRRQPPAQPTKV